MALKQSRRIREITMITPLIVANWKMSIERSHIEAFIAGWPSELDSLAECVVAPPAAYLMLLSDIRGLSLAGQDCSDEMAGAFTGETSAATLATLGCRYGIVGHSERRARHGESDALVATKSEKLESVGITPIICVGESASEREGGETAAAIERQVLRAVDGLSKAPVIAYEPVWAIGTGNAAEPSDADQVQEAIGAMLTAKFGSVGDGRVLYGGSVKPDNTADFMSKPSIDGLLVGGASLSPDSFADICRNAGV